MRVCVYVRACVCVRVHARACAFVRRVDACVRVCGDGWVGGIGPLVLLLCWGGVGVEFHEPRIAFFNLSFHELIRGIPPRSFVWSS